ncbi:MAG: AIR synthase family protein [Chloroflexota bacterium]|nr:AIR synthase family protein [Chloroflexota bacterium]
MESRLGTGKLPAELLGRLVLGRLGIRRSETLVHASLGIDAAAIAVDADWACVLTTDPITTAALGGGSLAVHVVCNDLAVMGAEPVGVLATLLFPDGVTPSAIAQLSREIDATARELNVEVLGGHTEVAPVVSAPLVVMTGVGKARRDRLLTAGGARPGDALVLTKAAGLEGSYILASDLRDELIGRVPDVLLDQARGYATELSVVTEARAALDLGATAMHDPTEGGIVGATWEMAEASGCGFRLDVERIVVRPPTRAICDALGADPLRLIASGALLVACGDGPAMVGGLTRHGIPATEIGRMTESPRRDLAHLDGRLEPVHSPGRDELYRVIEQHHRTSR